MVSVIILSLLLMLVGSQAALIDVDWSRGNLSISVTTADTLNFTFNATLHNVYVATDYSSYVACTGFEICADSPCQVDLAGYPLSVIYVFCNNHCLSQNFKSIIAVTDVITFSPSNSPSRGPTHGGTHSPSTPTITTAAPVTSSPTTSSPMVTASPTGTLAPVTPSPSSAPVTPVPSISVADEPTTAPVITNAPTPKPSKAPVTRSPTTPDNRLSLYIQMDHSGSIRQANPTCKLQSGGKTCWELEIDFVAQLVGNVSAVVGWADEEGNPLLRVYISYFSCNPNTNAATDQVATIPALITNPNQFQKALTFLQGVSDWRMYGTCPSLGAQNIFKTINVGFWPTAYYIVTDGQIQNSDVDTYRNTMVRIRQLMAKKTSRLPCALTIGDVGQLQQLQQLMGSACVLSTPSFGLLPDMAQVAAANILVDYPIVPAPSQTDSNPSPPTTSNGDSPSTMVPTSTGFVGTTPSSSSFGIIVGGSSVAVLLSMMVVVVVFRRRRQSTKTANRPLAIVARAEL